MLDGFLCDLVEHWGGLVVGLKPWTGGGSGCWAERWCGGQGDRRREMVSGVDGVRGLWG